MVQLQIHIRPLNGYSFPNKVLRNVTVDSADRLEEILNKANQHVKRSSKPIMRLFHQGRELPLNSSLASHNIQSGDMLESCSSPLLSAVLTALLNDFNKIQKLPDEERTEPNIRSLLDPGVALDPFPDRWEHEHVETRIITMAYMKKVLQCGGRFGDWEIPQCTDLYQLHDFFNNQVLKTRGRRNNNPSPGRGNINASTMANIFKPSAKNRNGQPSTVWELMQYKLDKVPHCIHEMKDDEDMIETFVRLECQRHHHHGSSTGTPRGTPASRASPASRKGTPASRKQDNRKAPPRPRRKLPEIQRRESNSSSSSSSQNRNDNDGMMCTQCQVETCTCVCLTDACPFFQQLTCLGCFVANHPILQRNHEKIALTDTRAKDLMKRNKRQSKLYIPQYASGPFACLAALARARFVRAPRVAQHSLTETLLKEQAQPMCRSDLYDKHVSRGENAFACMDSLAKKELVRKETIVANGNHRVNGVASGGEAKYSLIGDGEILARGCKTFQEAMESVLMNPKMARDQQRALWQTNSSADVMSVKLIVDSREDSVFVKRLKARADSNRVPCETRELPGGDYLFTVTKNATEHVFPIVLERKTWSDFADSISGKGKRRLDCVRVDGGGDVVTIGGVASTCTGGCQLCRMKRSGCRKKLFVIEGGRCLNRDGAPDKCTNESPCRYCRDLLELRGLTHLQLEQALYQLQAHHNCLVFFTRNYNETIDALFTIRDILGSTSSSSTGPTPERVHGGSWAANLQATLSFEQFKTNVRRRTRDLGETEFVKGKVVTWTDLKISKSIVDGEMLNAAEHLLEDFQAVSVRALSHRNKEIEVIDLEDEVPSRNGKSGPEVVILDDNDWGAKGSERSRKRDENDDDVIVLDSPEPKRRRVLATTSTEDKHSRGTSLLIVKGMYEYDQEFLDDANKMWQQTYKNQHDKLSVAPHRSLEEADTEFLSLALHHTRSCQQEEPPLVGRSTIMFWLLYIQLRFDVLVHTPRTSVCARELINMWNGSLGDHSRSGSVHASALQDRQSEKATLSRTVGGTSEVEIIGVSTPQNRPQARSLDNRKRSLTNSDGHSQAEIEILDVSTPRLRPSGRVLDERSKSRSSRNKTPVHTLGAVDWSLDDTKPAAVASNRVKLPPKRPHARPPRPPGNDFVREARLKRFGGSTVNSESSERKRNSNDGTWECQRCTLENPKIELICRACDSPRIGPDPIPSSIPSSNEWQCSECTLSNDSMTTICIACETPRSRTQPATPSHFIPRQLDLTSGMDDVSSFGVPDLTRPHTGTARTISSEGGSSGARNQKCGACGAHGHNRATATAQNCAAFYDEAEVERRNKKKEEAQKKLEELNKRAENAKRQKEDFKRQAEVARREVERFHQMASNAETYSENELKRIESEKKKAAKRLQKFGG